MSTTLMYCMLERKREPTRRSTPALITLQAVVPPISRRYLTLGSRANFRLQSDATKKLIAWPSARLSLTYFLLSLTYFLIERASKRAPAAASSMHLGAHGLDQSLLQSPGCDWDFSPSILCAKRYPILLYQSLKLTHGIASKACLTQLGLKPLHLELRCAILVEPTLQFVKPNPNTL